MKKIINHYFPSYIFIPLASAVLFNFITYFVTKIITNNLYHYNLSNAFDDMIPFLPIFIIIYILAFVQWVIGYIIIARESKEVCYKYMSAELIAKAVCLAFFFILPTTLTRPKIKADGFILSLLSLVYTLDAPVNLFPSIHCLESWMVFRASLSCKKVSNVYRYITFIFSILVCLSTVFVRQHVVIDIIGGILVVEFGIFMANKFNTARLFYKIDDILLKTKDDNNERRKEN